MHTQTSPHPTYEAAAAAAQAKEAAGYHATTQNLGTDAQPKWVACWWKAE